MIIPLLQKIQICFFSRLSSLLSNSSCLHLLQGWTLSANKKTHASDIDILIPGIATVAVIETSECMYACLYFTRYFILQGSHASA
jgi:hypothetical protein